MIEKSLICPCASIVLFGDGKDGGKKLTNIPSPVIILLTCDFPRNVSGPVYLSCIVYWSFGSMLTGGINLISYTAWPALGMNVVCVVTEEFFMIFIFTLWVPVYFFIRTRRPQTVVHLKMFWSHTIIWSAAIPTGCLVHLTPFNVIL